MTFMTEHKVLAVMKTAIQLSAMMNVPGMKKPVQAKLPIISARLLLLVMM